MPGRNRHIKTHSWMKIRIIESRVVGWGRCLSFSKLVLDCSYSGFTSIKWPSLELKWKVHTIKLWWYDDYDYDDSFNKSSASPLVGEVWDNVWLILHYKRRDVEIDSHLNSTPSFMYFLLFEFHISVGGESTTDTKIEKIQIESF